MVANHDNQILTIWDADDNQPARSFAFFDADGTSNTFWVETFLDADADGDTDVEFLKRVIKDVRGGTPTALEEKYFAEDKDPKKREKLLDQLLKDPAVAKKLGDDWKKKMLGAAQVKEGTYRYQVKPRTLSRTTPQYPRVDDPQRRTHSIPRRTAEPIGSRSFLRSIPSRESRS